jgi:hypothetical protein
MAARHRAIFRREQWIESTGPVSRNINDLWTEKCAGSARVDSAPQQ